MNQRYSRQILFEPIGAQGQRRIGESRVVVIGCGALGSAHVETLARSGVGRLRVVDRDFVEESNLQRQTLFSESDARERVPKAIAARRRVGEINSETEVEAVVADVHALNIESFIKDADVVLDGTDNFSTRYLINDACVKHGVSWIYGAAVGALGVTMTIRPDARPKRPCLRCIFADEPAVGSAATCDTAGIIAPVIAVVSAAQTVECLKLIVGRASELHDSLMQFDVWRNEWRRIKLPAADAECRTCGLHFYENLDAEAGEMTSVLCGRDAVQIRPARAGDLDLNALGSRLRAVGDVQVNEYLLRLNTGEHELTVFRDARAIVRGTSEISVARSLYARYVGN